MHTSVGNTAPEIGPVGLDRFRRLADHAESIGVRLAFENLEPLPHLHAVMEAIGAPHGFCWDCGHNLCYTPAVNMMERYGDRLICTHIHDNHGITRPGYVHYHDDLHRLPFDGVLNWEWFAETIRNSPYAGPLTLELTYWPEYRETPFPAFLEEAYRRAEKIRNMVEQEKTK